MVASLLALAGVASAELGSIGGIGTRSMGTMNVKR
jgi:hypothetical protein